MLLLPRRPFINSSYCGTCLHSVFCGLELEASRHTRGQTVTAVPSTNNNAFSFHLMFFDPAFIRLREWLGEAVGVTKRGREGERLWKKTTRDGEKGESDTVHTKGKKAACNSQIKLLRCWLAFRLLWLHPRASHFQTHTEKEPHYCTMQTLYIYK